MGTLQRFDLTALRLAYGVRHFVETGTGKGDGLRFALRHDFDSFNSCELDTRLTAQAYESVGDDPRWGSALRLFNVASDLFLRTVLADIPVSEPILFWLDAHFPGADYGHQGYGAEPDVAVRLPLRAELETIARMRPGGRDVLLIDDLRLFQDGPYRNGNLPADVRAAVPPATRSTDFIHELLHDTHQVRMLYEDEGYAVLVPTSASE